MVETQCNLATEADESNRQFYQKETLIQQKKLELVNKRIKELEGRIIE